MRTIAIISVALVLSGCGSAEDKPVTRASTAPTTPASLTVTGTITVEADSMSSQQEMGGACVTDGGYSDIQTGAQVTVADATGKALALGALEAGHVSEVFDQGTAVEGMASLCVFAFTVNDVLPGESIYSVEVSHRGKINFTREKLNEPIALTLG